MAVLAVCCVTALAQQPITFEYFYDDLNQLTKVVDSTGVVVTYVYDPVGNITQITRSSVAPGALTIFNFTPQDVLAGGTVTIQGQGFSATAANDIVTINGVAAQVLSATATTLVIMLPGSATSGAISVTVGGITATSSTSLTILPIPVITSITPKTALAGASVTVSITGYNLGGSTFSFNVPSPPPVTVTSATIDPSGTSASLVLAMTSTAMGHFTLIGTNSAGPSDSTQRVGFIKGSTSYNTLTVPGSNPSADPDLDGLTNAQEIAIGTDPLNPDTDGDGYPDGMEVVLGSDPLNPLSIPNISPPTAQQPSFTFSLLNGTDPGSMQPVSQQPSFTFSVLNGTDPGSMQPVSQQPSFTFSLLNGTDPGSSAPVAQGAFVTFSILNSSAANSSAASVLELGNRSGAASSLGGSNPTNGATAPAHPFFVFAILNVGRPPLPRKDVPDRTAAGDEPHANKK